MAILIKVFETEFCSTKWDSLSQGQFARGQSDINPKIPIEKSRIIFQDYLSLLNTADFETFIYRIFRASKLAVIV